MLTFKTISRDVSRPSRRKTKFTRDVYEIAPRKKKYVLQPTTMTTTTTTTTATKAGSRHPGARKSAKKFNSFIPLLRRRNTEDFIIADRDERKDAVVGDGGTTARISRAESSFGAKYMRLCKYPESGHLRGVGYASGRMPVSGLTRATSSS